MPGKPIFVSHASADSELVDAFVDYMLDIGARAAPDDVFYSSGHAGYGAASGTDLMATIREQISDSTLVIALITPTYQTRPVCIAELGAAWGRAGDNLIPALLPGMSRGELQGVLAPMTVRSMDDEVFLTEVHARVCTALDKNQDVASFTRATRKWQAELDRLAKVIARPTVVTEDQLLKLQAKYDGAQQLLVERTQEVKDLRRQIENWKAAEDDEGRREALLPAEPIQRFEALRSDAFGALKVLGNRIVREAIWAQSGGSPVYYPNRVEDPDSARLADDAISAGHLKYDDGEPLELDDEFPDVAEALEAVGRLEKFLAEDNSDFDEWFAKQYRLPKRLSSKRVWDKIFPPEIFRF